MKKFKELSEERKWELATDMVTDDWYSYCVESFCEDMEAWGFEIDAKDISFSGFWSQGDGASFTTESIDLNEFIEKEQKDGDWDYQIEDEYLPKPGEDAVWDFLGGSGLSPIKTIIKEDTVFTVSIKRSSTQCVHKNSVVADIDVCDYLIIEDASDEDIDWEALRFSSEDHAEIEKFKGYLETYLENFKNSKCDELYNKLEEEYEGVRKANLEMLEEENGEWNEKSSYY